MAQGGLGRGSLGDGRLDGCGLGWNIGRCLKGLGSTSSVVLTELHLGFGRPWKGDQRRRLRGRLRRTTAQSAHQQRCLEHSGHPHDPNSHAVVFRFTREEAVARGTLKLRTVKARWYARFRIGSSIGFRRPSSKCKRLLCCSTAGLDMSSTDAAPQNSFAAQPSRHDLGQRKLRCRPNAGRRSLCPLVQIILLQNLILS